jgi:hypothetical protein
VKEPETSILPQQPIPEVLLEIFEKTDDVGARVDAFEASGNDNPLAMIIARLDALARRLDELAAKCGMKSMGPPPAIFVPADFRRHVENLGFVVEETPEWFDP